MLDLIARIQAEGQFQHSLSTARAIVEDNIKETVECIY